MTYTLMKLPYSYDSLEPVIDKKTVEIHHDKHHQAYVDNLNKVLQSDNRLSKKKAPFNLDSIQDVLKNLSYFEEAIRNTVKNNAGGIYNHDLYWQILSGDKKNNEFKGKLAEAISKEFGNYEKFKELLSDCAMKRFGSGWAWLVLNNGKMEIYSTANQDCPISEGKIPLLGIDVWEHAYYLKYMNKRKDYVDAIFNIINWKKANEIYLSAISSKK